MVCDTGTYVKMYFVPNRNFSTWGACRLRTGKKRLVCIRLQRMRSIVQGVFKGFIDIALDVARCSYNVPSSPITSEGYLSCNSN